MELLGGPFDGGWINRIIDGSDYFFVEFKDKLAAYKRMEGQDRLRFVMFLPFEEEETDAS